MRRVAISLVWLTAVVPVAYAQSRAFDWYGELMSVAPDGKSAHVRVSLAEPVLRYIGTYPSGERLMLVWAAGGAAVVYAPRVEEMNAISYGYLVPAELVSVDAGSKTATIGVDLSAEAATVLRAARPGSWIKVVAPVAQRAAIITSVQLSEKPKPPPPPAATATANSDSLTGQWVLTATRRSGVSIGADCPFKQEANKLTGRCTARNFETEIAGEVNGSEVTFDYLAPAQNDRYNWKGTLDASRKSMKGIVIVEGQQHEFTAVR